MPTAESRQSARARLAMSSGKDASATIRAVVSRIPRGRVSTYGQIALLAGRPRHARYVGHVLSRLDVESGVPWHRVVNARGEISRRSVPGLVEPLQRKLLEQEGVEFLEDGRIPLRRFFWSGA